MGLKECAKIQVNTRHYFGRKLVDEFIWIGQDSSQQIDIVLIVDVPYVALAISIISARILFIHLDHVGQQLRQ